MNNQTTSCCCSKKSCFWRSQSKMAYFSQAKKITSSIVSEIRTLISYFTNTSMAYEQKYCSLRNIIKKAFYEVVNFCPLKKTPIDTVKT